MQMMAASTPRGSDKSEAVTEMESQLEESQAIISQLRTELGDISTELDTKERELNKVGVILAINTNTIVQNLAQMLLC